MKNPKVWTFTRQNIEIRLLIIIEVLYLPVIYFGELTDIVLQLSNAFTLVPKTPELAWLHWLLPLSLTALLAARTRISKASKS